MFGGHAEAFDKHFKNRERAKRLRSSAKLRLRNLSQFSSSGSSSRIPATSSVDMRKALPVQNGVRITERKGAIITNCEIYREAFKGFSDPKPFEPSSHTTEQIDYIFHLLEVCQACKNLRWLSIFPHYLIITHWWQYIICEVPWEAPLTQLSTLYIYILRSPLKGW